MSYHLERLARVERFVLWSSAILPSMFVALLLAVQWPEYWKWINFEMTPMTWLEVSVMMVIGLVAFSAGAHAWIRNRPEYLHWNILAAGFFYFALDDRFALHERLRDKVLIPNELNMQFLPWIGPGDYILLLYAGIGLFLSPSFMRLFSNADRAKNRFVYAITIAAMAVLLDTLDINLFSEGMQRLEQTIEECLELSAQILFLQAFVITWFAQIAEMNVWNKT